MTSDRHERSRARAIVFDLDGTLVDSLPDIVWSFRAAFDDGGRPIPSEAAVRELIGAPLDDMAAAFTDDPAAIVEVCAAYRRIYPQHFTDRTVPFPGVVEVLEQIRAAGFHTAIATTKRSSMAISLVEAVGLAPLIDHVQGTDGFPHKPAPDVVHAALRALDADGVWMVGDTVTDLQAGRAAGLRTYGVSWGTHGPDRLAEAEPDVLEPNLDRLPALVE